MDDVSDAPPVLPETVPAPMLLTGLCEPGPLVWLNPVLAVGDVPVVSVVLLPFIVEAVCGSNGASAVRVVKPASMVKLLPTAVLLLVMRPLSTVELVVTDTLVDGKDETGGLVDNAMKFDAEPPSETTLLDEAPGAVMPLG